jgi:hypothetical protein
MSDNRTLNSDFESSDYHTLAAAINKVYCDKHGYDFAYYRPYLDNPAKIVVNNCKNPRNGAPRHAAWSKILASILAMKRMEYDYFVYIDSDCIFRNTDMRLEDTIGTSPESELIFMNSRPWDSTKLCSGFYILKNSVGARQFILDCHNYDSGVFDTRHHWEQEAFRKLIESGRYNSSLVDTIWFDEDPGQQLRHVGSHTRMLRVPYFRKFIVDNNINYSDTIDSITPIVFSTLDVTF